MAAPELILIAHCTDRVGLVASISNWIFEQGGNVLHLDQHVDDVSRRFFIRVHWQMDEVAPDFKSRFDVEVAHKLELTYSLTSTSVRG